MRFAKRPPRCARPATADTAFISGGWGTGAARATSPLRVSVRRAAPRRNHACTQTKCNDKIVGSDCTRADLRRILVRRADSVVILMPRKYMPQHVFDVGAATIAKIHLERGLSMEALAKQVADSYRNSFVDDEYERHWIVASRELIAAAKTALPYLSAESMPSLFWHMQFFLTNFELDGTKKKRRLFSGTRFIGLENPTTNRVQHCVKAFMCFFVLSEARKLPFLPTGWSLC